MVRATARGMVSRTTSTFNCVQSDAHQSLMALICFYLSSLAFGARHLNYREFKEVSGIRVFYLVASAKKLQQTRRVQFSSQGPLS